MWRPATLPVLALWATGIMAQTSIVNSSEQLASKYAGSVFKFFVYTNQNGEYPAEEGTCFVIYQVGARDNPTLYLMTAAHTLLGEKAIDDSGLARITRIEIQYSRSCDDCKWTIRQDTDHLLNGHTVFVPSDWSSSGSNHDFALFKVEQAGRQVRTVPIALRDPKVTDTFTVWGFEGNSDAGTPINGRIQSPAGLLAEPWFLADINTSPGNSGGPAFANDGVFALVEGRHTHQGQVKTLVPISLALHFLQESIPRFEFRTILQREASAQLAVECLKKHQESVKIKVPVNDGDELLSADAVFDQTKNIKSSKIDDVSIEGSTVIVSYVLVGRRTTLFGCPDGSARLKVTAKVFAVPVQ